MAGLSEVPIFRLSESPYRREKRGRERARELGLFVQPTSRMIGGQTAAV
jgi:hypothetical protein